MSDLISRQSVIDALEQGFKDATNGLDKFSPTRELIKAVTGIYKCYIEQLPTIQPEPHWIPVTERLPKEKDAGILKKLGTSKRSEYVLATVEVKGERMTVTACTYDGKWDWNMKYAFPDYKIVAWKPMPEPYKGVTDGRD